MDVSVLKASGLPDGSILSVRAGHVRRQGAINTKKPMQFTTGPIDSSPFSVDVFAPVARSRLTLVPRKENQYSVALEDIDGRPTNMSLELNVRESDGSDVKNQAAKEQKIAKATSDTQEYIEQHKLGQFLQNLMQSVLVEKPQDPFAYMEAHLRAARVVHGPNNDVPAPIVVPVSPTAPKKPTPAQPALTPTPGKMFEGPAFTTQDSQGTVKIHRQLAQSDILPPDAELRKLLVPHLSDRFHALSTPSPLRQMTLAFKGKNDVMLQGTFTNGQPRSTYYQMLMAGPRKQLHCNPKSVTACIVTCGGLCPGLNAVIREVVMMLSVYGVEKIYGVKGGYKGVVKPASWIELTPLNVQDIHMQGGTILVSDRGNPPHSEIAATLKEFSVSQYFVIGGDGTLKGGNQTYEAMVEMGWECAVVGIPKTIDNDIAVVDKTFGFDTACTEARKAIESAYVEATCNANCIGLVKLMGRHSGFIAMNACLAARVVDICLLPEMQIDLGKVLQHALDIMQTKGHAVIVVAEGCGDTMIKSDSGETDAGGNKKLADVGPWLKSQIEKKFKEVRLPLSIKYIDPTYMIRAVPPNSYDSVYCTILAQNAVHAAMAGYTGVTVGRVQMRYVLLPINSVVMSKNKRVDVNGSWFLRLVSCTRQPSMKPDAFPDTPALRTPSLAAVPQDPLVQMSDRVEIATVMEDDTEIRRVQPERLSDVYGERNFRSPLLDRSYQAGEWKMISEDDWTTQTLGASDEAGPVRLQMLRAGPRQTINFEPEDVAAAIVTCGRLCPGVNSVVREIVMMLDTYGVKKVYGIKGGFLGVTRPHTWMTLTPDSVVDIHMCGGSILVNGIGNPPEDEMARTLQKRGVRTFFVVGGHGTHRCALNVHREIMALKHECSVFGIPQAVDNDISLLDKTFGFETACTEANKVIDSVYVEATCNSNCVGLVKLLGKDSGYIPMSATLAARHVDICLLPEMEIQLERLHEHIELLLKSQGYCVIVVAEGCNENIAGSSTVDVGLFLQNAITFHFSQKKMPCDVRYMDPTFMIQAVPANANDSIYCSVLAHAAVHGAMAGFTGVTCAKVDERFVYLPIQVLTDAPKRKVDLKGPWFERLMATTMQPSFGSEGMTCASPVNPAVLQAKTPVAGRRRLSKLSLGRTRTLNSMAELEDEVTVPDTKLRVLNGFGEQIMERALRRADLLREADEIRILRCFHLNERYGEQQIVTPLKRAETVVPYRFCDNFSWSTQSMRTSTSNSKNGTPYCRMTRGGPREFLHFDPHDPASCAAIVSCGGICPGLNSVIRELVNTLWAYGVRRIWGIIGGFKGVMEPEHWIKLTPSVVQNIHTQGGTLLISDRGNPPHSEMAKVLQSKNVKQYFVLGGDGTHLGAMQTFDACLEVDHECAVIGVPKTIDNDIVMVDQTFGFDTACEEAKKAVQSAYVEATSNANCIGLVKLMGRHCGHITMNATLAASLVDICLLPEMSIDIEKVLEHAVHLMRTKKHAVIVVAEGCGDTIMQNSSQSALDANAVGPRAVGEGTDAGGNKKLADVGPFMKNVLTARFKQLNIPLTIKFIDPTYMIRSVPANSYDSNYCATLAQNAVHGAMAGFSGVTVGKINGRMVYLPIYAITKQKGKRVDINGSWYLRMMHSTKQPDFSPATPVQLMHEPAGPENVLCTLSTPASINTVLQVGDEIRRLEVTNLKEIFPSAMVPNPTTDQFVGSNSWACTTLKQENKRDTRGKTYIQLLRGGPREHLHFNPRKSAACIVTCGGLCPGLNSVIRELTLMLLSYGVPRIYGCIGGYKGLVEPEKWITLTADYVRDIHLQGGSVLVSDRGNPPHDDIAKSLASMNIRQYFVLGGDGTHKGGQQTFEAMMKIGHECAVVGIPKTIDNDIALLDRSFGFNTACTEAQKAISSAYVEATSNDNCIGLVKLMGRHCGFVALGATLAARHVDICLLPEMDVSLPRLLQHLMTVVKKKGYAVVVVAEGCGETLVKSSAGGEVDAGGHAKMADPGIFLKAEILKYFGRMQVPCRVMYTDPTYMIRAVPPNPNDNVYCTVLAQYGVHAAMAGYTGISIGKVDGNYVMLPIHAITVNAAPQRVDTGGTTFQRMVDTTGQPDFSPGPGDDWALLPKPPPKTHPRSATKEISARQIGVWDWKGKAGTRPSTASSLQDQISIEDTKLRVLDGFGHEMLERQLRRVDMLQAADEVRNLEVMRLSDRFAAGSFPTPLKTSMGYQDDNSWACQAFSLSDRVDSVKGTPFYRMLRAGPREHLHFDPADPQSCAAIITCGALCPGLNTVIRELVLQLDAYGVQTIYGIPLGFNGVMERGKWQRLTPEVVKEIHRKGGSIIGSAQGNPPASKTARVLAEAKVRQFFAIGGDGTQKGALQVLTEMASFSYECSVVCVPKTIDNDLPIIDKTFGFDTACTEARKAIETAYVEATCNANCIGFVKLMGMQSGFVAMNAALASRTVDICLLPEMEVDTGKLFAQCEHLMKTKGYAVIVMAEGCGGSMLRDVDAASEDNFDVGVWLKDQILAHFKKKQLTLTIKYIDPTYMIRTVPANAYDSVYCTALAQHAVHGSMAGVTGCTVARVYERYVYLPIHALIQGGKRVNVSGRWMARLVWSTRQPTFAPDDSQAASAPKALAQCPTTALDMDAHHSLRSISTPVSINELLHSGDELCRLECMHLGMKFQGKNIMSPLVANRAGMFNDALFLDAAAWSTQTFIQNSSKDCGPKQYLQMLRSGPRNVLYWDSASDPTAAAAIVTCGGICPGLNSVIREVVLMLKTYGIKKIYGIIGGYKGTVLPDTWIDLTEERVQDIHKEGGSILVSDRGNPPHSEIAASLKAQNIRQYFVLGGDGTQQGAFQTFEAMQEINYECSVVGIPKTIDNDIALLDTSFGFDTACTEAAKAIDSGFVESSTNANCIGLVKLMGRHCGFIALHATLAARNVDICLIPEMTVSKEKLLDYVAEVMLRKKQAVIVVAEGCGDTLLDSSLGSDAGGNKILADIGPYLKDEITAEMKRRLIPCSIKYIDPTYMIRSVPANAYDSLYCSLLAQQAVHGAMAGYTGVTVGKVDERYVMLPVHAVTSRGSRKVDTNGRMFERLMNTTRQPSFAP